MWANKGMRNLNCNIIRIFIYLYQLIVKLLISTIVKIHLQLLYTSCTNPCGGRKVKLFASQRVINS